MIPPTHLALLLAASVWGAAQGAPGPGSGHPRCPAPPGVRTISLRSQVFGNTRLLRVWLPPGYDSPKERDKRYPVLYLNDGQDVFDTCPSEYPGQSWHVDQSAAHLIGEGKVRLLIIVGIDNAGHRQRAREYLPYPDDTLRPAVPEVEGRKYPDFLMHEVIPLINSTFRTNPDPSQTGIGGSSYGAGIALYTVEKAPGRFGRLLLESPSLYAHDDYLLQLAVRVRNWPRKTFIGVGTVQEPVEDVKALQAILTRSGLGPARLHTLTAEGAAHNPDAWAARFPAALEFLYGKGP